MTAVVTHEIGAARLATSNYLQYAVCHHDPSCLVVDADGGVSWVRVDVARRSAHVVRRIHPSSEAACVVAMALSESLYAAVADSTRAITVYDAAVDGHRVPFVSLLADASVVSMAFTSDPHLIVLTRTSLSVYDVMDRASNVKRVPGVTAFSYCPTSGLVYRTRDHVFVDDPTPTTVRVPMGASGARLVARIGPDRLVVVENQQPRLPASLVDGCFPTDQSPMDHLTNVVSDAAAVPPSSRVIVTDYAGNDNTCERFDDEFASIDMAAYDTKDGLLAVASFTASKVHVVRVVGDSLARTWNHDFSDGARVRGLSWHRDPARDAVFLFVLVVRPGGHPAPVFQPRYLSGPSSLTVFEHRVGPAIDRAPSPSSPVLDKLQEVLDAIADLKMQIVPEIAAIQSRLNTLEQRFR